MSDILIGINGENDKLLLLPPSVQLGEQIVPEKLLGATFSGDLVEVSGVLRVRGIPFRNFIGGTIGGDDAERRAVSSSNGR